MYAFQIGEQTFTIRQARPEEGPAIFALLVATARWIQATGSVQWSHYLQYGDEEAAALAEEAKAGSLYVVYAGDRLAGSFSLVTAQFESDVLLWGQDQGEAAYLHRLAVDRAFRGIGLGLQILDWVLLRTKELGKEVLRLDCVAWVEALHRLYSQRLDYLGVGEYYGFQLKKWEKRVS